MAFRSCAAQMDPNVYAAYLVIVIPVAMFIVLKLAEWLIYGGHDE